MGDGGSAPPAPAALRSEVDGRSVPGLRSRRPQFAKPPAPNKRPRAALEVPAGPRPRAGRPTERPRHTIIDNRRAACARAAVALAARQPRARQPKPDVGLRGTSPANAEYRVVWNTYVSKSTPFDHRLSWELGSNSTHCEQAMTCRAFWSRADRMRIRPPRARLLGGGPMLRHSTHDDPNPRGLRIWLNLADASPAGE